jgi:hypothetical protein
LTSPVVTLTKRGDAVLEPGGKMVVLATTAARSRATTMSTMTHSRLPRSHRPRREGLTRAGAGMLVVVGMFDSNLLFLIDRAVADEPASWQ